MRATTAQPPSASPPAFRPLSAQAESVNFATADGTATADSDYEATIGTLTFVPGETEKTITIEVKGDNKPEADEVFYLDLYDASGTSLFAKSRGVGTIVNDD